ncbi:hypothetical protein LDB17_09890 [Dysgonomonas sp. Shenzhen-Wh21]|uniref:hypothetical protein n=1 Tax=Dysgonomonas TaxID=156973 RepID=UPI00208EF543|nr:hypothetical protein [Dysgonomonas mossii]
MEKLSKEALERLTAKHGKDAMDKFNEIASDVKSEKEKGNTEFQNLMKDISKR